MGESDPTHRRRSASIVHAAGGKHMASSKAKHGYRQTSLSLGTNGTIDPGSAVIHEDSAPSSSDLEMNDMRSDEEEMTDDEETGLTQAERRKRRRRKRRSTMLDERVAAGNGNPGDLKRTEEQLATATLIRMYGLNAILIALWYTFSISISVYNKWMFSKDNLDFHYPLFTTSLHMVVQFTCATAVLFFFPQLRPGAAGGSADPHAQGYSQVDGNEDDRDNVARRNTPPPENKGPLMTRWFYITRIAPCGMATAFDIGLGNFSLRFISLTFYTMCKSSVLAFVLLFAFIFRLEKPSWRLGGIITLMSIGVVMMVAGETAFNALGFILVMTASFCSGFRWSLTQILLLRNPATSNPFSSIFFLTPAMFLALLLLALPIEGPTNLIEGLRNLADTKGILLGTLIMLFPGALAFMMVAAEFALLKRTSVVTLSVCGIFKEVLTITVAGVVFGDELSPINVSGLIVTIASIAAYNYLKYLKMRSDAQKQAHELLEEEEETDEGVKTSDRRLSYDETESDEPRRHRQTSALMRHSLSLATGEYPSLQQHGAGQSSSQSPVKRPENLE